MALLLTAFMMQAATSSLKLGHLLDADNDCNQHDNEIVVCGRRDRNRLPALPETAEQSLIPPATFRLPGGGTGRMSSAQVTNVRTGKIYKRATVGATFHF